MAMRAWEGVLEQMVGGTREPGSGWLPSDSNSERSGPSVAWASGQDSTRAVRRPVFRHSSPCPQIPFQRLI